jgi:integrase
MYAVLSGKFAAAVRDRVIAASPCTGIRLPELEHSDHLILTPEQVHALAAELPERYRAMVYLGAGCGLRHGEVPAWSVATSTSCAVRFTSSSSSHRTVAASPSSVR